MLFANALVSPAHGRTKKLRERGPRLRSLGNERDLMFRFIAFLRAINVGGGRTESLGFFNVATFIASGNVVFETTTKRTETLERMIEKALKEALGYEVRTFVRREDELAKIANYRPFPGSKFDETWQSNIIFLADNSNTKLKQNIRALRTKTDAFEAHGREIYWRRRRKQNGALFSTVPLEKILGPAFTVRGANTIKRIVSKYRSSKMR
jgi:uncharacterized protein (DUF1697 family)